MTEEQRTGLATYRSIPELADTAQHIEILQAKIDRLEGLTRAKMAAWEQVLTAAARLYRARSLDVYQVQALLHEMRDSYGVGFSTVWEANMPINWRKVDAMVARAERDRTRGAYGTWSGTFPLDRQPRPPAGASVVYVIFDAENIPCYVGSTHSFTTRMEQHGPSKRGFHSWTAYPCRDRDHAYDLEGHLLRQYKPYMNVSLGRQGARDTCSPQSAGVS